MDTILFWALILIGSALFVYLVPYKNIKIIQKLQRESLQKLDTILFWTLIFIGSALFVYLVPYKNIKIIQKLQRESLQKLDTIIELLKKKN